MESKRKNCEKIKESESLFGLELLENLVENAIQNDYERIIVLFHWFLISNGYGCIGKGDAKEVSGDEIPSELLPEGWNLTGETDNILLRYFKEKKLYLARITKFSEDLIFNFIRDDMSEMKVTSCIVPISHVPDENSAKITIIKQFQKNILDFGAAQVDLPRKFTEVVHGVGTRVPRPSSREFILPYEVGRADLDPFAANMGLGGGNLAQPSRQFPPGPRIRYDPVGPFPQYPGWNGPINRNHFRPPRDFDDDMFM